MMAPFKFTIAPSGTEFRLPGDLPVSNWSIEAPSSALPGVDLLQQFIAADEAIAGDDVIVVEHATIAKLSAREAELLGLPPLAEALAEIQTSGLISQPSFQARLSWKRPSGQPLVGVERAGAWLRMGENWRRLPDVLFAVAEAVDALAQVPREDQAARFAAISRLRETLPGAQAEGLADAPGAIGTITIAIADAFALDLQGSGHATKLVPVLFRAGADDAVPLLPSDQQETFGSDQFHRFSSARSVYSLSRNAFLVLAPTLRRALDEVRRVQAGSVAARREFFASPRTFLREALGDEADPTVVENVFRETPAYSERVLGLGLWKPRVLPWISIGGGDWFGDDTPRAGGTSSRAREKTAGLMIGDRKLELSQDAAVALRTSIEDAIAAGEASVPFADGDNEIVVPATAETLQALETIVLSYEDPSESGRLAPQGGGYRTAEVLLIRPNEEEVELEAAFARRDGPVPAIPHLVRAALKPHQSEGLQWLQGAWSAGRPGTLLADDMGLGKTLQALAFLAWLREGMVNGTVLRAPVLIVAPTGLLENWRAEHERHLRSPGLGTCLRAYGAGLREIRRPSQDGRPGLDVEALQQADWVLTTYETLRDHDRDFGQVRFAVLVFDEAQKIKTPGIRLTDAAKAMNADFRVALTGTPVENRLGELWCIVDTVHPAYLDDLRTFSARYERNPDADALRRLKRLLDRQVGGCPPLMLRRMKEDRLPELPPHGEKLLEREMPGRQLDAYRETVEVVRAGAQGGGVLAALQRLRSISLHPTPEGSEPDEAFIAASARLAATIEVLDQIHRRGEAALLFLEDLAMQARLAGVLQRRYGLRSPPMIINGQVAGGVRQARVDAFQQRLDGFDVMILSPKAGGVGLTLTRANHVIHLSRWWNPAVEDQCNGRAIRIGQSRPVTTYLPIAVLPNGNRSFDQNLNALLDRKRALMREALCPPAVTDAEFQDLLQDTVGA